MLEAEMHHDRSRKGADLQNTYLTGDIGSYALEILSILRHFFERDTLLFSIN